MLILRLNQQLNTATITKNIEIKYKILVFTYAFGTQRNTLGDVCIQARLHKRLKRLEVLRILLEQALRVPLEPEDEALVEAVA